MADFGSGLLTGIALCLAAWRLVEAYRRPAPWGREEARIPPETGDERHG